MHSSIYIKFFAHCKRSIAVFSLNLLFSYRMIPEFYVYTFKVYYCTHHEYSVVTCSVLFLMCNEVIEAKLYT